MTTWSILKLPKIAWPSPFNDNDPLQACRFVRFGERISLFTTWQVGFPTDNCSDGDRLRFRPNKEHAVKINSEDKHRETYMYTSFFKREPRTNSTLPIHRISKAISENKHGRETEGNVHVYLNTEDKHRETCMFI